MRADEHIPGNCAKNDKMFVLSKMKRAKRRKELLSAGELATTLGGLLREFLQHGGDFRFLLEIWVEAHYEYLAAKIRQRDMTNRERARAFPLKRFERSLSRIQKITRGHNAEAYLQLDRTKIDRDIARARDMHTYSKGFEKPGQPLYLAGRCVMMKSLMPHLKKVAENRPRDSWRWRDWLAGWITYTEALGRLGIGLDMFAKFVALLSLRNATTGRPTRSLPVQKDEGDRIEVPTIQDPYSWLESKGGAYRAAIKKGRRLFREHEGQLLRKGNL